MEEGGGELQFFSNEVSFKWVLVKKFPNIAKISVKRLEIRKAKKEFLKIILKFPANIVKLTLMKFSRLTTLIIFVKMKKISLIIFIFSSLLSPSKCSTLSEKSELQQNDEFSLIF